MIEICASIDFHAKKFLYGNEKCQLPKKIHDALYNVFVKEQLSKNTVQNTYKFRKEVIESIDVLSVENSKQRKVKIGKSNAIYNALCLLNILGTGETRKLFILYFEKNQQMLMNDLTVLDKKTDLQVFQFFCLGIKPENVENIKAALLDPNFDLFSHKLPSPFNTNVDDLMPMLGMYDADIPWQEYIETFQKAEKLVLNKQHFIAKTLLLELLKSSSIYLPVADNLLTKINIEIADAENAQKYFNYLIN